MGESDESDESDEGGVSEESGVSDESDESDVSEEKEGREEVKEKTKQMSDREKSEVEAMACLNHWGKAARLLRSAEQVQEATPGLNERLAAKFPEPRTDIAQLDKVPARAPRFILEQTDFVKILESNMKGGAGGDQVSPEIISNPSWRALMRWRRYIACTKV